MRLAFCWLDTFLSLCAKDNENTWIRLFPKRRFKFSSQLYLVPLCSWLLLHITYHLKFLFTSYYFAFLSSFLCRYQAHRFGPFLSFIYSQAEINIPSFSVVYLEYLLNQGYQPIPYHSPFDIIYVQHHVSQSTTDTS